jgi:hypothetical protein
MLVMAAGETALGRVLSGVLGGWLAVIKSERLSDSHSVG